MVVSKQKEEATEESSMCPHMHVCVCMQLLEQGELMGVKIKTR